MKQKLFILFQYLAPQWALTSFAGWLAENRTPWFKNWFIRRFIKHYRVDMSEAKQENPLAYPTFNSFFIRELKPNARPIHASDTSIISPADGCIAQIGAIQKTKLLQAKGAYFTLNALFGGENQLAELFKNGNFTTVYLAPHNYHRVHMPIAGKLIKTIFIPGKLFSVNQTTAAAVPNLYSRNERFICLFETQAGPMAVILVGAMIVGSIQTVWMKKPVKEKRIHVESYTANPKTLAKGAELGHFKLGSTVIVLFANDRVKWETMIGENDPLKFGQLIGNIVV